MFGLFLRIMHRTITTRDFFLLMFISITIWVIPEPFQKLFRVAVLVSSPFLLIERKSKFNLRSFVSILSVFFGVVVICLSGNFQSSIINIVFSALLLFVLPSFQCCLSESQIRSARKIALLCCFSMLVQLVLLRSSDGRPKLAYETNLGGAYLSLDNAKSSTTITRA